MTNKDIPTALELLIDAFSVHQKRTRGLRDRTLKGNAQIIRLMVRHAIGGGRGPHPFPKK